MTTELVHSARPPALRSYFNPVAMAANLWAHRHLTWQMARRELETRYRGQTLGVLWAVITPLIMLAIYTFVFAVVFPSRWGKGPEEALGTFALGLFGGLLVFGLFRDMAGHGPSLIIRNRNYVKRVVFPLEILSVADLAVALVNFAIGSGVWLAGWALVTQQWPHWQILLVPILILPVCLAGLGVSWILASLGAFLRDVSNIVELALAMLLFLTPVFYNLQHVPEPFRTILSYNPLARVIESVRGVTMQGVPPDWAWWGWSLILSAAMALAGYAFFCKSRRAFADVV